MFIEKYVRAVNSANLQDDEHHVSTHALTAAALADLSGGGEVLGSMLARVKYAYGTHRKTFESGAQDLAGLLRIWHAEVERRGRERQWVRIGSDRDIQTAHALYKRVAEKSLAHWLNPNCTPCAGTGTVDHLRCTTCGGKGKAEIECKSQYELERIKDMLSELEGIFQSHGARAAAKMRRAA